MFCFDNTKYDINYCNLMCHKQRIYVLEMRTFLGGLIKQPRKSTISMAVWTKRPRKWELFLAFRWNSQGEAQFPWRFDEEAKEMRTFLGVICKPPRQLQIFLAAYKIRHEIIFSWLLTSTAKVTLYSLAVQSWPPRKSLAAKVIRFWCSERSSI